MILIIFTTFNYFIHFINYFINFINYFYKFELFVGGASRVETDSGLFIYSKFPFLDTKIVEEKLLSEEIKVGDKSERTKDSSVSYDTDDCNNNNDNNNNNNNNDNNNDNNNNDNYHENNSDDKKTRNSMINEKLIYKKTWDPDSGLFSWKNVEDLISNPRVISQVLSVCPCNFFLSIWIFSFHLFLLMIVLWVFFFFFFSFSFVFF